MFDRSAVLTSARRRAVLGSSLVLLAACGGKVVVETEAGRGSGGAGASSVGGTGGEGGDRGTFVDCSEEACGTPCEVAPGNGNTGVCTELGDCAYDTQCPIGPCENKLCGDGCTVCNDVECLMGRCTADQQCVPDDVACPGG